MFIRGRLNRNGVSKSYQVLETYREGGKIKQRVVCNLGPYPTPEMALEKIQAMLPKLEKDIDDLFYKPHYGGWVGQYRWPFKQDRENREYRRCKYERFRQWVNKLEDVVSRRQVQSAGCDTTIHRQRR